MSNTITRRGFLRAGATAVLGLAATKLAGCASPITPTQAGAAASATPANSQAFLNYWTGWSGFEFDALQILIDKFNQEHPNIFVNMTTVFGQYDKVLTAIAGGNPPDVVSAVWLNQLTAMAARDGLTPLDEYAARDGIDGSEYFKNVWDAWHADGHLWGLMVTVNADVLGYRRDLFAEVGLDPDKPPTTIAELDEAARALDKIDSNGNIERYGFFPTSLYWWGYVFGGSYYDEASKKMTLNDPKIVAALDWMRGYAERLDITKVEAFESGFGDYASPQNAFFSGKQAMTRAGEWFISFADKFSPGLDFDFMPAPYPAGGRPNCTTFDGSCFTIPRGVAHPEASWEFIKWLSQPANLGEFAYTIQNIPPKIAVANEERFNKDPRFKKAVALYTGDNAFGPPRIPVVDFFFSKLGEAEGLVKHGEMDPEAALNQANQEVQDELEKALARSGN